MTSIDTARRTMSSISEPFPVDEAQLAAVAFLARYSGRTLDAYRHDLRNLFQWAADHDLAVLAATRTNLELYRGLDGGARTGRLDDRPAPVHCLWVLPLRPIDGRISSNPAQ